MDTVTQIQVAWELKKAGCRVNEIAGQLGKDRSTIYRWLNGIRTRGIRDFQDPPLTETTVTGVTSNTIGSLVAFLVAPHIVMAPVSVSAESTPLLPRSCYPTNEGFVKTLGDDMTKKRKKQLRVLNLYANWINADWPKTRS
jgi:hypothetical protein